MSEWGRSEMELQGHDWMSWLLRKMIRMEGTFECNNDKFRRYQTWMLFLVSFGRVSVVNGKQWTIKQYSQDVSLGMGKSTRICQILWNGKVARPSLNINQELRRRFLALPFFFYFFLLVGGMKIYTYRPSAGNLWLGARHGKSVICSFSSSRGLKNISIQDVSNIANMAVLLWNKNCVDSKMPLIVGEINRMCLSWAGKLNWIAVLDV